MAEHRLVMMKRVLISLVTVLCLAACSRPDGSYYKLEGGDDAIDWIEFVNDSTLRWVGPGPRLLESRCARVDTVIVVETAPLSRGFLFLKADGTLEGQPPFFEGTWKPAVKLRKLK